MTITKISNNDTGQHELQSQSGRTECWLDGWIAVPDHLEAMAWETLGWCDLDIQDGVLVGITPTERPEPEPAPEIPDMTAQEQTAMMAFAATSTEIPDNYALDMPDLFPTWERVLAAGKPLKGGCERCVYREVCAGRIEYERAYSKDVTPYGAAPSVTEDE